ncbi:uncharacterized protein znf106b isoform X2 [Danio aesculapii]|uniref:uncharacterized protein znf106b isoform X2 n=1 Tax=Danio aesculapii TaxID=1142201 RepID=UPI0024C04D04|nr:uncharacterized protein znf106b isoform X2 [Danio aesculapii]
MKAKPNQAKAKTKKKRNYVHVKPNIGRNYRRCLICGQQYGEKNLSSHIHSYVHHEAIEHIKGSKQLHNCFACDVSVMGLEMYEEHISTPEHTHRLFLLHTKGKQKQLREDYNIVLTKDELRALKIRQQRKQQHKDCSTCFVCCKSFPVQDIDVHMNGCLHHQMIEQLKGRPQVHKCRACELSYERLANFNLHIQTIEHQYMMFKLKKNTADGQLVDYNADMDDELRNICAQRRNMEKRKCWGKGAQAKTTYNSTYWSTPVVVNEFTNAKNRNDSPTSTQLIQILSKWRQEGMRDMDNLNGPLVKPAEHRPPEVSAHTTHPNPEKRGGDVYDVTPETEGGASVEPSCSPALVQSRLEAHRYSLTTTARQDCTNQKKTTEHEAVVLQHPQEKAINAVFEPMARKEMNEVQPHSDSLPSVSSLPETALENQTSKNDSRVLETAENVQPHAVCMKRKKSNESEKEQSETFLENHNIQTTKKRKQDISHNGHNPNPERNGKIFKKGNVNKLLALSLKEDELTRSLENVGDQLIQAHSILQSTYTEVQRLLAVKQQVTSEMASLREKRMKILQQMKNTS